MTNVVANALLCLEVNHKDSDKIKTDDNRPQLLHMTVHEAELEEFLMSPQLIPKERNKDKDLKFTHS